MVSAWACANGLVLGQVKTKEKSNEITAIPQLLQTLEIEGCIVTIDAMGCQKGSGYGIGASGILTISRTLGQTLGVAIFGSFWMWNMQYNLSLNNGSIAENSIKIHALQNIFYLVSAMIFCTIVLSIAGYFIENSQHLHT